MKRDEYISAVISQIQNKKARTEVERELSAHIDDRISYYTDAGWDEETANEKAMEHMGEPEKVSEEMGKIHNKKISVFLKITISFFAVIVILIIAFRICLFLSPIDDFIKEQTKVYTPSGIPTRHHVAFFSIDTDEYWVYKLSDKQCYEINEDIKNGTWEKLELRHYWAFPWNYSRVFMNKTELFNDCYIVIYDASHNRFLTNSNTAIAEATSNWVIIIYDKTNGYYYCIHQTM